MSAAPYRPVGYIVVYKFNTHGGGIKGQPVTRHGHYKVYNNWNAANRRRLYLGADYTEVRTVEVAIFDD